MKLSGEFLNRATGPAAIKNTPGYPRCQSRTCSGKRRPTRERWAAARDYIFFSVALMLLRRFAAAVFFRVMLGGSKCCRRRASEMIDSCCTRLVKRLRKPSKLSPSLILISTNSFPGSYLRPHSTHGQSRSHLNRRWPAFQYRYPPRGRSIEFDHNVLCNSPSSEGPCSDAIGARVRGNVVGHLYSFERR